MWIRRTSMTWSRRLHQTLSSGNGRVEWCRRMIEKYGPSLMGPSNFVHKRIDEASLRRLITEFTCSCMQMTCSKLELDLLSWKLQTPTLLNYPLLFNKSSLWFRTTILFGSSILFAFCGCDSTTSFDKKKYFHVSSSHVYYDESHYIPATQLALSSLQKPIHDAALPVMENFINYWYGFQNLQSVDETRFQIFSSMVSASTSVRPF